VIVVGLRLARGKRDVVVDEGFNSREAQGKREARRLFPSPYVCLAVDRCVTGPKISELQQVEAQADEENQMLVGLKPFHTFCVSMPRR